MLFNLIHMPEIQFLKKPCEEQLYGLADLFWYSRRLKSKTAHQAPASQEGENRLAALAPTDSEPV